MALTPEERAAVEKDINDGLKQIATFLSNVLTNMPIALERLNPHATSTRRLRAAYTDMVNATQELKRVLDDGIVVKKDL